MSAPSSSTPRNTAKSRRWPKVLALLLLPALVAALLLAGLGQPAERLDTVSAAIVNRDKPVEVQGQLAPLGRQLAQAVAHPATGQPGTYDWVVTNLDDAEAGLAVGSYAAVVVIPPGFSRAATSLATDQPRQATIDVRIGDRSGLANGTITQNLTAAAEQAFGAGLTEQYLQNLYLGVGELRIGLGQMSAGADELTTGTGQLADGMGQLSTGLDQLAGGTRSLASGTGELADGAGQLDAGMAQTAAGADRLGRGSDRLAGGIADLADGAAELAAAMRDAGKAAAQADEGTRDLVTALGAVGAAYELCQTDPPACAAALQKALSGLPDREQLIALATASATANAYLNGARGRPGLVAGTADLADGTSRLADGSAELADGTRQLADGLQRLSTGTGELADGTVQLADGATQLSDGTSQAAAGAQPLAVGTRTLSEGAGQLADGLRQAADQVPSYTRAQRQAMSQVAATPIVSEPAAVAGLGWLGSALLVTLTLWLGGLVTWLVLRPVAPGAYESSRSAARLAWRAARPGLLIGALQGLLVGTVVAASLDTGFGGQTAIVLTAVLAGAAFTALLQGVMGLFGLLGGVVAVAWGAVALAAGLVATVPSWFGFALTAPPLGPLVTGLQQVASGAVGFPSPAVVTLLVLAVLGFLLTIAATRRAALRRSLPSAGLVPT